MATSTRTRPARKKAGKKAGPSPSKSKRSRRPGVVRRLAERWGPHLGRADVWGALLVVGGVLAALGTYAGLTGPWG
ncbi:MAG: hypothetical protein KY452_10495, partial [Actinobacteria bacterium]|nr:hypothetical protein [Actinomycetota bacterium]